MWYADFVRTGLTGDTDFIILYLVTRNGLQNHSWFSFQGNIVKVSRVQESKYSAFAPTF
jgi:hypothetical protein